MYCFKVFGLREKSQVKGEFTMKKICILVLIFALLGSMHALTGFGESNVFSITEQTLPVQLSSFTAITTAQNYVSLNWITQSETALLGYRIYRSENDALNSAIMMTPDLIPATNTSTTQSYNYNDMEVAVNSTYYYWLESLEYNTSEFFGPISVIIASGDDDIIPPGVPVEMVLLSVYPNPFQYSTRLNYYLAKDAALNIDICNVNGQLVRSYEKYGKAGNNWFTWDGRDNHAVSCASGIYFVNLRSGSHASIAKLVLIK